MNDLLYTIDTNTLDTINHDKKLEATKLLEQGKIIYFPTYSFLLKQEESSLLTPAILHPKHKNISYDFCRQHLNGIAKSNGSDEIYHVMQTLMHRFAVFSKHLIDTILPHYSEAFTWGRTSYRPAEIKGRNASKRKDDTRLHVDSFKATPVHGLRILRVFCNINPQNAPRSWLVGEPFTTVAKKFLPKIPPYHQTRAQFLKLTKITKTLRTAYDHYMLHLHDQMKLDDEYQQNVIKHAIDFPAQSTWIVFTDHVSHAALSGQFLLEQTFYLPVEAMNQPALSPLRELEQFGLKGLQSLFLPPSHSTQNNPNVMSTNAKNI